MTIEIIGKIGKIGKITENWKKEEVEELKATNPSFIGFLEKKEKEWKEVKKLEGKNYDPLKPFFDYCVVDDKYTTKLHDFNFQDGNTRIKACQRNGCRKWLQYE